MLTLFPRQSAPPSRCGEGGKKKWTALMDLTDRREWIVHPKGMSWGWFHCIIQLHSSHHVFSLSLSLSLCLCLSSMPAIDWGLFETKRTLAHPSVRPSSRPLLRTVTCMLNPIPAGFLFLLCRVTGWENGSRERKGVCAAGELGGRD